MKVVEYNKDIYDISNRQQNEYYIGDIVQIKILNQVGVKNAMIAGYNHLTDKWIVKYENIKSGIKYEEVNSEQIVKIKSSSVIINNKIPKNYLELENYIREGVK